MYVRYVVHLIYREPWEDVPHVDTVFDPDGPNVVTVVINMVLHSGHVSIVASTQLFLIDKNHHGSLYVYTFTSPDICLFENGMNATKLSFGTLKLDGYTTY